MKIKRTTVINLYKIGDMVTERVNPARRMTVSRYDNGVYYCRVEGNPKRKPLTFLERDLQNLDGIKQQ